MRVAVHGSSALADRLRRALAAQPDLEPVAPGAAAVHALLDHGEAPRDVPSVRLGASRLPLQHSAWGRSPAPAGGAHSLGVPDAPTSAILRPLRAIPGVTDVHVVRVAPGRDRGPIDALVPQPTGAAVPPPWPPGAAWTTQTVAAPQTRCWLIAAAVRAAGSLDRDDVLAALAAAPRVLLVSRRTGFTDSGVLCEFFRDAGRPAGDFFETVVFADSLAVDGPTASFWAAAEAGATVVEAVDALRTLCRPELSPAEAAALTDRALGRVVGSW